jgi:Zn-dependent peptidase ImmA (M78 family)
VVQQVPPCSRSKSSPLVRLFTERTCSLGASPVEAIQHLVSTLRGSSKHEARAAQLDGFLIKRKILETRMSHALASDGYVEPLGPRFQDGFRMVLKAGSPLTRSRFTIAHELCHTFFYEMVPELKYGSTEVDAEEERLCNLGASELLIPSKSLKKSAKKFCRSVDALEELAKMYLVSPAAMLLRLRDLKLWSCELSYWRPHGRGFALDRIVGGRKLDWQWPDDNALRNAWSEERKFAGRTYVELRDRQGGRQLRMVCFQVVRRGNLLMALWSAKPFEVISTHLPLFETPSEPKSRR